MARRLFAVEHYDSSGDIAPGPVPALTTADTRLVAAVHLPADEVVLALVEGPDVETVTAVAAAVWRADRVTPAHWLGEPPDEHPEPEDPMTGEQ